MLNKNIIKDALVDAKEIEKFAIEQAKKSLEEALMPQIEKAIQDSLNEKNSDDQIFKVESLSESTEKTENILSENSNSKNIQEMYNEKEEVNEELFEVEGLFEEEETAQEPAESSLEAKLDDMAAKLDTLIAAAQGGGEEEASAEGEVEVVDDEAGAAEAPAPAPAAPAPAAPAPAAPAPAPAEQPTVTEDTMFEIEEDLEEGLFEMEEDMEEGDKVYEIEMEEDMEEEGWKKVEEDMEEEGLFEIDMEEDMEEGEDDVDPKTGLPMPPKEWGGIKGGMVGEDMEEENLYEIDMEEDMEESIMEKIKEEMEEEGLFEIDMEEENLEEKNYGGSFTSINRAGNNARKEKLPMHAPMNESKQIKKIKTQYESKLDGLLKENESLKGVIKNYKSNLKEFENSFIELKTQLNEMQIFNGKLAYANKLLTKGGLTNDEKIRIAEEFDKCATVEDAKRLYNKIISENNFSSKTNSTDKLKSAKPSTAVQNLSENKAEKLFESQERKRMRMLAGIVKPTNE